MTDKSIKNIISLGTYLKFTETNNKKMFGWVIKLKELIQE